MSLPAAIGFVALLASMSAIIVRIMIRRGKLDHPGARSSHTTPTPKGGGVGIVTAFVVGLTTVAFARAGEPDGTANPQLAALLAATVLVAAVSWADDLRNWPFAAKLATQSAASTMIVAAGLRLQILHLPVIGAVDCGWLGVPLTVGWLLFVTNAINFIDGLNGLASGSVAIACAFLAATSAGRTAPVPTAALALAAGIGGFLPYNYPRARIFMGDVGSQPCGFIIAGLAVMETAQGTGPRALLLVPLILSGILFDVAFTLVRRLLAGDRITHAHRGHLYQVAHRAGIPAARVTLVYWAMAAWSGSCTVLADDRHIGTLLLAGLIVPQATWLLCVFVLTRRHPVGRW